MINQDIQLLLGLGCGALLCVMGFIFYKFPPKEINHVYGYRSKRSMVNKNTWKSANIFSAILMLRFGILTMVISGLLYIVCPQYNALISCVVMLVLLLAILPITERYLKRHFSIEGNSKNSKDAID